MSKSVLVLGANGRLGRVVVQAFADAGWTVLAQARRPLPEPASANVRHVSAPLGGVAALVESMGGADVVVNAINPLYTRWDSEALPMARAANDVALRLGAVMIFPGNVYNFGASMPALLTETSEQHPTTQKGMIRRQMEQELRDRAADGLRSLVVRAGDFFGGPGSGTWMDMAILKNLAKGRATYLGPMNVVHSWAYLPDLARTTVALAEVRSQCAVHEVFHFPGHAVTGTQFVDALTDAARRTHILAPNGTLKVAGFPWPIVRLGGLLIPIWREVCKMRYLWNVPHRLSGDKLAQAIGAIPHTPIEQALTEVLVDAGLVGTPPAVAMRRPTHVR